MSDAVNLKSKKGGTVTVSTQADGRVVVRWLGGCGTRKFDPGHLRFAIQNLEDVAERSDGHAVWMLDADTGGSAYACSLSGGRFYADATPGEDVDNVSWAQLRKALMTRAPATAPEAKPEAG